MNRTKEPRPTRRNPAPTRDGWTGSSISTHDQCHVVLKLTGGQQYGLDQGGGHIGESWASTCSDDLLLCAELEEPIGANDQATHEWNRTEAHRDRAATAASSGA